MTANNQNGNMFLYGQAELLTLEEHGSLGLTPSDTPYALASGVRAVPITVAEFASAQRNYPIVFTNIEAPYPVAVVGLLDDDNLYMENGNWDPACYVPAYLRCHPFAFAGEQEGRIAVVIDREAPTVTQDSKYPFFVDGKLASETESMMRFCAQYEAERQRTVEFCRTLKDLGVLATQRATHTPDGSTEEQILASYVSVDAEKLAGLNPDKVVELHKSGRLAASYLQLYSMENWHPLMLRRERRIKKAS